MSQETQERGELNKTPPLGNLYVRRTQVGVHQLRRVSSIDSSVSDGGNDAV